VIIDDECDRCEELELLVAALEERIEELEAQCEKDSTCQRCEERIERQLQRRGQ
jgi:hypothetical protein